jgi:hypothetical protein
MPRCHSETSEYPRFDHKRIGCGPNFPRSQPLIWKRPSSNTVPSHSPATSGRGDGRRLDQYAWIPRPSVRSFEPQRRATRRVVRRKLKGAGRLRRKLNHGPERAWRSSAAWSAGCRCGRRRIGGAAKHEQILDFGFAILDSARCWPATSRAVQQSHGFHKRVPTR